MNENLPNGGVGVTSAQLLNSAAYVKVKKLGIGNALGTSVFPGGEQEMLDRIKITGFEIIGQTVITKFEIIRIPTATTTGPASSTQISSTIAADNFNANVLSNTVTAIANEPQQAWNVTGSIFTSAPTDQSGESTTSLFVSHDGSTALTLSAPVQNYPGFTTLESEYTTQENLPNNGVGITNAQLLSSAVYVRVKKLGVGKALGDSVFPNGEREMLERIEIIGFEIVNGNTVKTKFRINRISTSNTGITSSSGIKSTIASDIFRADVLTHTIAAITAEPASAWTSDSLFNSPPTDSKGTSDTSLFVSHNTTSAVVVTQPPTDAASTCSSGNLYFDTTSSSCKLRVCTCMNGVATTGSGCATHNTENCASCTATGFTLDFPSPNVARCIDASQPTVTPTYTSISSEYRTQENLPSNGTGITSQELLNSAIYVKVKKLGLGKALGLSVFPQGEQDMLDRIEITGFEIDTSTTPPSVVTKYKIKQIPTAATGAGSSTEI